MVNQILLKHINMVSINLASCKQYITQIVCGLLLSLFFDTVAFADVNAEVDRNQIQEGDTIALTISVSGNNKADPDFYELEKSFDIVSRSQSSSYTITNFKQHQTREWRLQMFPKNTGNIVIPEIPIGNEKTSDIKIQVRKHLSNNTDENQNADPVFIKVSLDTQSAYIQQEVIITAKIYQAVQLDNMQMSDPDFNNASVKKIHQTSYQTTENGLTYRVHELRYSLFPREAGELIIPEFVFSALAYTSPTTRFSMGATGSPIRRISKPLTLKVKPIPLSFTGKIWLPARTLRIKEEWRGNQSMAQTGKAITRNVIVEADGLLSAQLPELPKQSIEGIQIYPDQPILSDQDTANGIRSTREEPVAIIPTKPGTHTLPELRITWWDIDTDQQKEAILPASQLIASGEILQNSTATPSPNVINNENAPSATIKEMKTVHPTISTDYSPLWKWLALFSTGGWLISIAWFFLRTKKTNIHNEKSEDISIGDDEESAFKQLRKNIIDKSHINFRKDFLHWAEKKWPNSPPRTLDAICQRIQNHELTQLIQIMENQRYSTSSTEENVDFDHILTILETWRNLQKKPKVKNQSIPDLYES